MTDISGLGHVARSVWAKTAPRRPDLWLSLPQHLHDAKQVALLLLDEWVAPGVRSRWADQLPGEDEDLRALIGFLAAVHDVAKATPAFVSQVDGLAEVARRVDLECPSVLELVDERKALHHSVAGEWVVAEWLLAQGVKRRVAERVASVVGAHHGRTPGRGQVRQVPDHPRGLGGPAWQDAREDLLEWADRNTGAVARMKGWDESHLPIELLVQLSGLIIMADWLASNQDFFLPDLIDPDREIDVSRERTLAGWDAACLPGPWCPEAVEENLDDLFRTRFDWALEWTPTPLQRLVCETAKAGATLMIVEAPMGAGKTEAALASAELLAARDRLGGLVVALPTQATTNAMFMRVARWIQNLPPTFADDVQWSITLGHGKATLQPAFAQMVEEVREAELRWQEEPDLAIDSVDVDSEVAESDGDCGGEYAKAVAHQWFSGRKRRMLSNFAVATIDQILMAATRTKHQMLNHLALANKVVVLDEVHASDAFMNTYLRRVLAWLGRSRVPVIMLSATLTTERRLDFLEAYAGRALALNPELDNVYPRVTWLAQGDGEVRVDGVRQPKDKQIEWEWISGAQVVPLVVEHFRAGGCVLVVRNTVADAQRTARELAAAGVTDLTLAHSRFMACDRVSLDAQLVDSFGREASLENGQRPQRHVVVATQVVEQSLDVDFDLIVSDLAPMDLLLQRMGRLHRHPRSRPSHLASPRALLVRETVAVDTGLAQASDGSHRVYGDDLLWRTGLVLDSHGPLLDLPDDIPILVEAALGSDPLGEGPTRAVLEASRAARLDEQNSAVKKAQTWAMGRPRQVLRLNDWLATPDLVAEKAAHALVRDVEPTVEVLLVCMDPDGAVIRPPWHGGEPLDVRVAPDRKQAMEIVSWAIGLPPRLCRPYLLEEVIGRLERQAAVRSWAWRHHPLIKGELLLPMTQTHEGSWTLESTLFADLLGGGSLRYSPTEGMEVVTS